jgi:hypothetical protein
VVFHHFRASISPHLATTTRTRSSQSNSISFSTLLHNFEFHPVIERITPSAPRGTALAVDVADPDQGENFLRAEEARLRRR